MAKEPTSTFEPGKPTELAAEVNQLKTQLVAEFEKGLEKNNEKIERLVKETNGKIEEFQRELNKHTALISVPGTGKDDPGKFQLGKAIKAMRMFRNFRKEEWESAGAGYECEVIRASNMAWEKKAMGALGAGSAGAFIVPEELMSELFIPQLYAQTVSLELGATEITMPDATPINIPRQDAGATASWVGENPAVAISATDLTLGNVQLIPKRLAARTTHSEELGAWSSPQIGQIIARDHAAQIARGLDLGVLKGSGAGGQPTGIITALNAGANDYTWTGAAVGTKGLATSAYSDLLKIEGLVADGNGLQGRLGWAAHPKTFRSLRLILSENATAGTASLDVTRMVDIFSQGAPTALIGYPYRTTTQLVGTSGTAEIVFGNWIEAMIARWGGLMLKATDVVGEAAAKFQFDVISSIWADVGFRHLASFAMSNNVATV